MHACMIINFPIYQSDVFHSILGGTGAGYSIMRGCIFLPPTSYMVGEHLHA